MQDDPKYQPGDPPTAEQTSGGVVVSPDTLRENRIPPGQPRTRKWPVLHAGRVPAIDLATWRLDVTGRRWNDDSQEFRHNVQSESLPVPL